MVKHNNALTKPTYRKHWTRIGVRNNSDQAGRKKRRLQTRRVKARNLFPRPTHDLRPVVHACTRKYATKLRLGRGFTLQQLQQAGLTKQFARTIGIAVDHRRVNRSQESLERNVDRLKQYKTKIVLYPRHLKYPKKGQIDDASKDLIFQARAAPQVKSSSVLALPSEDDKLELTALTDDMKKFQAHSKLRRLIKDKWWKGKREKRARDEKEAQK